MKIDDLPTSRDSRKAQCPKCGALSGGDWAQCEGFCPISVSPHYALSTEVEYGDQTYNSARKET